MTNPNRNRTAWVDHLRSFITLVVIAHHAAMAYAGFAFFNKDAYILSTHPVVDRHRWAVLDVFIGFNDSFFMPLMFLISGMFTLTSLRKKGSSTFVIDRFRRLFIPFLIAVTIFMWIAYYPAWILSGKPPGIRNYLTDFFTVEAWPVGPPWFIWVLFLFNLITALAYKPLVPLLTRAAGVIHARPVTTVILFFALSILLYVPAAVAFGSFTWTGAGPFDFQKSRLLLYFGYFIIGTAIGATDFDRGLFSGGSLLVSRWPFWMAATAGSFLLLQTISVDTVTHAVVFSLTTAFANIAFLTAFKTFSSGNHRIWQSLSARAYGMYLIHYVFVVWCQYALLQVDFPAGIKFLIVFVSSTLTSWFAAGLFIKKGPRSREGLT